MGNEPSKQCCVHREKDGLSALPIGSTFSISGQSSPQLSARSAEPLLSARSAEPPLSARRAEQASPPLCIDRTSTLRTEQAAASSKKGKDSTIEDWVEAWIEAENCEQDSARTQSADSKEITDATPAPHHPGQDSTIEDWVEAWIEAENCEQDGAWAQSADILKIHVEELTDSGSLPLESSGTEEQAANEQKLQCKINPSSAGVASTKEEENNPTREQMRAAEQMRAKMSARRKLIEGPGEQSTVQSISSTEAMHVKNSVLQQELEAEKRNVRNLVAKFESKKPDAAEPSKVGAKANTKIVRVADKLQEVGLSGDPDDAAEASACTEPLGISVAKQCQQDMQEQHPAVDALKDTECALEDTPRISGVEGLSPEAQNQEIKTAVEPSTASCTLVASEEVIIHQSTPNTQELPPKSDETFGDFQHCSPMGNKLVEHHGWSALDNLWLESQESQAEHPIEAQEEKLATENSTHVALETVTEKISFSFAELSLDEVDQILFKKDFIECLSKLGASPNVLRQLDVHLLSGSIIAEVHGPVSAMHELQQIPLDQNVSVMGSTAKIMKVASKDASPEAAASHFDDGIAEPAMDEAISSAAAEVASSARATVVAAAAPDAAESSGRELFFRIYTPDQYTPDAAEFSEEAACPALDVRPGEIAPAAQEVDEAVRKMKVITDWNTEYVKEFTKEFSPDVGLADETRTLDLAIDANMLSPEEDFTVFDSTQIKPQAKEQFEPLCMTESECSGDDEDVPREQHSPSGYIFERPRAVDIDYAAAKVIGVDTFSGFNPTNTEPATKELHWSSQNPETERVVDIDMEHSWSSRNYKKEDIADNHCSVKKEHSSRNPETERVVDIDIEHSWSSRGPKKRCIIDIDTLAKEHSTLEKQDPETCVCDIEGENHCPKSVGDIDSAVIWDEEVPGVLHTSNTPRITLSRADTQATQSEVLPELTRPLNPGVAQVMKVNYMATTFATEAEDEKKVPSSSAVSWFTWARQRFVEGCNCNSSGSQLAKKSEGQPKKMMALRKTWIPEAKQEEASRISKGRQPSIFAEESAKGLDLSSSGDTADNPFLEKFGIDFIDQEWKRIPDLENTSVEEPGPCMGWDWLACERQTPRLLGCESQKPSWHYGHSCFLCREEDFHKHADIAERFDHFKAESVFECKEELKTGGWICKAGVCIVHSQLEHAYFVVYQKRREDEVIRSFPDVAKNLGSPCCSAPTSSITSI